LFGKDQGTHFQFYLHLVDDRNSFSNTPNIVPGISYCSVVSSIPWIWHG